MIRTIGVIALAFAVLAGCDRDKGESRVVSEHSSPDGHAFVHMPIWEDGVTDITIAFSWPTGWAFEEGRNPAVPSVGTLLLLQGGTSALSPQDVLETFNDANAFGNLIPLSDNVYGELSFPKEHFDEIIELGAELLQNPQFDPRWTARVQEDIKTNARADRAIQESTVSSAFAHAILDGTNLLDDIIFLTEADVDAVTPENLRDWHEKTFTRSNVVISVTGAITAADAGRAIDRLLSDLPDAAGEPQTTGSAPDWSPRTILVHNPDAQKTSLGIFGPLPPTFENNGDYTDLLALRQFSAPGGGPLFDAIRTDLRATYGLQAGFSNYSRDLRFMYIAGEVDGDKLEAAVQTIQTTYDAFREEPDLAGFDELRNALAEGVEQNTRYVDVAAITLRELLLDGRDPKGVETLADAFRGVRVDQLRTRLRQAFAPSGNLIVIAVSPDPSALPGACVVSALTQIRNCR